MVRSFHRQRSRFVRVSIAAVLAVVGVVLVWAALPRAATPDPAVAGPPSEARSPSSSPSAGKPTAARPTTEADRKRIRDQIDGLVLPESDPLVVSIPKIGVRSRLVPLGLDDKGAMETPTDVRVAGWFSGGPSPGALGPAVIAGHVTWNGAREVFFRLGSLRPGDQVSIARKDGKTAVFTVSRVAKFSRTHFPTQAVYGPIDHAGLRLITCGGTYDAANHKYLSNVVVFARLQAVHGSGG